MEFLNNLKNVPAAVGAYSQAVKAGGLLFCSGQIGIDPATGVLVPGGVEEELGQVLRNIDSVLAGSGATKEQIAMTSIFLADIADGKVVNKLYGEYVHPTNPPARQTIAVKDLPLAARVEISVIVACG